MKSLKSLDLGKCKFEDNVIDNLPTLQKNLKIEDVNFSYNSDQDNSKNTQTIVALFKLELLPNLRFFSFSFIQMDQMTEIMLATQSNVAKLQAIKFQQCDIPCLEMHRLRHVTFLMCKNEQIQEFLKINGHVVNYSKYSDEFI